MLSKQRETTCRSVGFIYFLAPLHSSFFTLWYVLFRKAKSSAEMMNIIKGH